MSVASLPPGTAVHALLLAAGLILGLIAVTR